MPEPLRIYLDQMFKRDVAKALREEGYDVIRASEVGQARADDWEILNRAIAEDRFLITLDEHFGDWAVLPLSKHPGVIRLKISPTTSENAIELLLPFLRRYSQQELEDHLVIISSKREKWIRTS